MKNVLLYPKPSQRNQNYWNNIFSTLSSYEEKTVLDSGKVNTTTVYDDYFLHNDVWHVDFFRNISMLKKEIDASKETTTEILFNAEKPSINMELKFVFYKQIFSTGWALGTVFGNYRTYLKKLAEFINKKHPSLTSLLDLDMEKEQKHWLFWLNSKGIPTRRITKKLGKKYEGNSPLANFLGNIYEFLFNFTDEREEWEKDRWDVRVLYDKYGIKYSKSQSKYYLNFSKIKNVKFRNVVKEYVKGRLLAENKFTWGTSKDFLSYISNFLNFISTEEPSWNDLKRLERKHIEKYIENVRVYTHIRKATRKSNPTKYRFESVSKMNVFLKGIQRYDKFEWFSPEKAITRLIYPEDYPTVPKLSDDDIKYIPDYVLNQLFDLNNFNDLPPEVQPVVWVAFKTGLRIDDVLGLTQDCLIVLNGKYFIVTDVEKTYIKNHKIPIDDELADMIAVLIHESEENSNEENNPDKFIFVRYKGRRKGKPYAQNWVQEKLQELAIKKKIKDENGEIYHFQNHAFRHTYAVKMLNGGADILVVQELLGHSSPEMTLRYTRLLDDTKRKAFEQVVNSGAFIFDLNGQITEVKENGEISEDILDMLWRDHKLTAIENPYGVCRARVNGDCPIAKNPPCLTANDGKPCYDLFVGSSDVEKYELYVRNTKNMVKEAQERELEEIAKINQTNLKRYEEILAVIKANGVIFGRLERMKRQQKGKGRNNRKKGDKIV